MTFVHPMFSRALVATGALLCFGLAPALQAASINYGNFNSNPPGVMFLDVTESSGTDAVPLYGPPTFVGLELGFSPTPAFAASSSGVDVDVTDGQLNYTIMSSGVTVVNAQESGVYSLTGVGTSATGVLAALSLRATVTQINGVNVTPIVLTPSSAAAQFNLIANPGVNSPWALATSVDVATQLAALGYGAGQNATKVDVVIDNQLVAISELGSTAEIIKTRFGVPEPTALALGVMGLCGLFAAARKRS
jgi:hypothetical protein